jgi:hypothetical protein
MESRLEGDIDLQGFLGIRKDAPREYKEIRMFVNIDADAPPEKLEEIVQKEVNHKSLQSRQILDRYHKTHAKENTVRSYRSAL